MQHNYLFTFLGDGWKNLKIYTIKGIPHWLGCRVVELLGLSSSTQATGTEIETQAGVSFIQNGVYTACKL